MLKLAHGLSFAELYERDGLARLDAAFLDHLGAAESALRPQLEAARAAATLDSKAESALILEIARHLDGVPHAGVPPQRACPALQRQAPVRAAPRSEQGEARGGGQARRTRARGRAEKKSPRRALRRADVREKSHPLARR